jgi:hypothetical protein
LQKSIEYIVSLLLAVASGLFLAGITPYSPIYFIFGIAFIFYIIKLLFKTEFYNNSISIFSLFIFFYSLIIQLLIPNTKIPNTIGLALPYLFFFIGYQCFKKLEIKEILNISFYMIMSQIVFITADAIWRLSHPSFYASSIYSGHTRELNIFYMFKFNSIMYLDANFVGVQVCLLYFFIVYLIKENFYIKNIYKLLIIVGILTILTTSRSSIITMFFFTIIFYFVKIPIILSKKTIMVFISIISFAIILILILLPVLSHDESFSTKFLILSLAFDFLNNVPVSTILFGVGMGNATNFIGIGAHNIIITLLLETGLTGLIIFLTFIYFINKLSKGKALYILFPFFTMGFSLISLAFPFFLIQLLIIIILEEKRLAS